MTNQAVSRLHDVRPAVLDADNTVRRVDVAAEMDAAVGDISSIDIAGDQVLVGVYVRGNILPSGLITLDMAKEDIWQGKVSRILMFGRGIKEDSKMLYACGERPLRVGEWIFNRVEDSFQVSLKGVGSVASKLFENQRQIDVGGGWPCRLIYLRDIYGRLEDPRLIV